MGVRTLYRGKVRAHPISITVTPEVLKVIKKRTGKIDPRHDRRLSISDYIEEAVRRDNGLEIARWA